MTNQHPKFIDIKNIDKKEILDFLLENKDYVFTLVDIKNHVYPKEKLHNLKYIMKELVYCNFVYQFTIFGTKFYTQIDTGLYLKSHFEQIHHSYLSKDDIINNLFWTTDNKYISFP